MDKNPTTYDAVDRKFHPKPSCRKCYGRGYIGRDVLTNNKLPCPSCLRREMARIDKETQLAAKTAQSKGENHGDNQPKNPTEIK